MMFNFPNANIKSLPTKMLKSQFGSPPVCWRNRRMPSKTLMLPCRLKLTSSMPCLSNSKRWTSNSIRSSISIIIESNLSRGLLPLLKTGVSLWIKSINHGSETGEYQINSQLYSRMFAANNFWYLLHSIAKMAVYHLKRSQIRLTK